jgi:PAS domain S-box-containing protein
VSAGAPERLFRQVFEDSPIGVFLISRDRRVVDVNPYLCRLLGYERDDLLGRDVNGITHPEDVALSDELSRRLFNGDIPRFRIEKRYLTSRGRAVWVDCSASVVRDAGGEPVLGIGVLQDITATKSRAATATAVSETPPARDLTDREQEVLQLLVDGLDAKQIALRLGITLNTCRGYLRTVLIKLGAHSQVEAVVNAARSGLIDLRPTAARR